MRIAQPEGTMLEHRGPDCTGTWKIDAREESGAKGEVRCRVCRRRYPATLPVMLAAMRENLLTIQMLALGLAGRLQEFFTP
jgi:uncharacterized protein YbaR (Trm112 family)